MPNRMRDAAMIYARLTGYGKGLVWVTFGYWILTGVSLLAVDDPANPLKGGDLVTWTNLFGAVGLLVTAGTVWQQWKDAQVKLQAIAKEIDHLKHEHLPETYVRQDVFEERLRGLGGSLKGGMHR